MHLGRYELLQEISADPIATTYAARVAGAAGFDKLVALTVSHAHGTSDLREEFLREARSSAHVRSPFVVATHDLGQADDGTLYTVTDLVLGGSLLDLLQALAGSPCPPSAMAEIARQAALGLHDVHTATAPSGEPLGLTHGDVRPGNVLLELDGSVRLAMTHVTEALRTSQRGVHAEMHAYRSPEELRGERMTPASDIFALGIVLYEGLTGTRLFARESSDLTRAAVAQGAAAAIAGAVASGSIPHELSAVASRALALDPAARFPSALALADAIRDAIPGLSAERVGEVVREANGARTEAITDAIRTAAARSSPSRPIAATRESSARLIAPTLQTARPIAPTQQTPMRAPAAPPKGPSRALLVAAAILGVVLVATLAVLVRMLLGSEPTAAVAAASGAETIAPAPSPVVRNVYDTPPPSHGTGVEGEAGPSGIAGVEATRPVVREETPENPPVEHRPRPEPAHTPMRPTTMQSEEQSTAMQPTTMQSEEQSTWRLHVRPLGQVQGDFAIPHRLVLSRRSQFHRCWESGRPRAVLAQAHIRLVNRAVGATLSFTPEFGMNQAQIACVRASLAPSQRVGPGEVDGRFSISVVQQ